MTIEEIRKAIATECGGWEHVADDSVYSFWASLSSEDKARMLNAVSGEEAGCEAV